MSADRKTSKGAPFEIWAANVPEDPSDNRTLLPVSRSKSVMISFTANPRSDAAATTTSAARDGSDVKHIRQMAKRIFFIKLTRIIQPFSFDNYELRFDFVYGARSQPRTVPGSDCPVF